MKKNHDCGRIEPAPKNQKRIVNVLQNRVGAANTNEEIEKRYKV